MGSVSKARLAIGVSILLAVAGAVLWANRSSEPPDIGAGPHILGEATEAVAVAIVASDSIVPTGTREGRRWYSVDLDTAETLVPVKEDGLALSGVVEFGRSTEYWAPVEWITSDYERLLVVLKRNSSASVFGLRGTDLVIVDWDMRNASGQTPEEEAAIFNSVAAGADPAVAFAELAKTRLTEMGSAPALMPNGSGLGLRVLDALWSDRDE